MCGNDLFMAPTDYLAERPATGPLQKSLKLGDVERLEYQKSTVKDKDKLNHCIVNVGQRKKAQPNLVIPSLLCASKLASLKHNRLLMQLCPFVDELGEFTETQLKSLSENGIHVMVLGIVLLNVLAISEKKAEVADQFDVEPDGHSDSCLFQHC